ncbi:unnamed protein product [Durusdinium trenchii]|uniref:Anticodon-binding domain-containing protein n=1 Tax=Durusdinium trenchii TaxID=1381693 RepID=A0ABP0KW21_9DINO
MQHSVLKASGHVDRFNDFMVKDVKDESKFFRADKLLEEVMEAKLQTPGITEAQRHEYTTVRNQDHPKFGLVESTVLTLFHADAQLSAQDPVKMTVGEAVRSGLINNETLGYFIVKTWQFLVSIGLKKEYIRFRQHLPTEMAHYACDCWDAEIFGSYGWLECVGIADRSAFDLTAHANAAKCDLQYKEHWAQSMERSTQASGIIHQKEESLEKPFEREILVLTKKSGVEIMKAFKKDGKMVKEFVEAQPQEELECIAKQLDSSGDAEVQIDGKAFTLTKGLAVFERKKEKVTVNAFTPGVIEPSFGIDRIFAMLLEHVYSARPKEDQDDKQTRGVLSFAAASAPYKCVILPLDQRIARDKRYLQMLDSFQRELCEQGLSFTSDESNATIGRRYARNDELGVPFAVTFDFETMEDSSVTLRERDTMWQIRLQLSLLGELLRCLCKGSESWQSAFQRFPHKKTSNEEFRKD